MRTPERREEVVALCKSLIESTKEDDVRYDALRILAETYKAMGEYELTKSTIQRIPELYFTKLELDAKLLTGEDMFRSASLQRDMSAEMLVDMLLCLADHYESTGENARALAQLKIAEGVMILFREEPSFDPSLPPFYEYYCREELERVNRRIAKLT